MSELTVAVPERVAEDLNQAVAWVRQHLDHTFTVESAVTEALLDWVGNVRLEFINVESDNETIDAVSAPLTAINGGQAR